MRVVDSSQADQETDRLMLAVRGGDKSALAELFSREGGRLVAIALRIVRRRDLAEEVVQDGFVLAWQRSHQFDPKRGRARAWLTRIVRNRALNLIRDAARLELVDDATLDSLQNRVGDAHRAYEALEELDALKVCLDRLEVKRRSAILLAYVTGLDHGEIAAALDAPLGTVKSWIRRGVAALQECLS
jgi:RNA polymerase sigma-70 factor (ECF subfamily)